MGPVPIITSEEDFAPGSWSCSTTPRGLSSTRESEKIPSWREPRDGSQLSRRCREATRMSGKLLWPSMERSVEIQLENKTRDVTLCHPR